MHKMLKRTDKQKPDINHQKQEVRHRQRQQQQQQIWVCTHDLDWAGLFSPVKTTHSCRHVSVSMTSLVISSVSDQNGVSQAWYIVEIHHSGREPSHFIIVLCLRYAYRSSRWHTLRTFNKNTGDRKHEWNVQVTFFQITSFINNICGKYVIYKVNMSTLIV